jgi:hypothetical protein
MEPNEGVPGADFLVFTADPEPTIGTWNDVADVVSAYIIEFDTTPPAPIHQSNAFLADPSATINVSPFDPSQGTLDRVDVSISGTLTASVVTQPFLAGPFGTPVPYTFNVTVTQDFSGSAGKYFDFSSPAEFRFTSLTATGTGATQTIATNFTYTFSFTDITDLAGFASPTTASSFGALIPPAVGALGTRAGFLLTPPPIDLILLAETWRVTGSTGPAPVIPSVTAQGALAITYHYRRHPGFAPTVRRTVLMRASLKLAAVITLAVATASAVAAARFDRGVAVGPSFTTIGPLAFAPDGTLYAADTQNATIFALNLGTQAEGTTAGTQDVAAIDQKIAAMLGTEAAEIAITDLVVHPTSRNSYLSVMRGQGAGAQAALMRVDGAGELSLISLETVEYTDVALPNPADVSARGRGGRAQSITDMAFSNGRLFVAGLSNEEFASKFWSLPYPFQSADRGTSVEIYHANHDALETRSPVYSFVPTEVDGKPSLIAGYLCTPLVQFPIDDLQPGAKVLGKTIAELGNRNRPIDMILYKKDGQEFLLMSNTSRGVMKMATDEFARQQHISEAVADTAGVPYETIESMTGVMQLDLLDATHSIVLTQTESGAINLEAVILP